jgi:hypothetical protein
MRVSERCHHVLITPEPDETLVDAAGRMHCYQTSAKMSPLAYARTFLRRMAHWRHAPSGTR